MQDQLLYKKIYDELLEKIRNGKYVTGDKVPSEKELSAQYNVSRITSKKALEMLGNDGVIVRMAGRGSFVAEQSAAEKNQTAVTTTQKANDETEILVGLIIEDFSESFGLHMLSGIDHECTKHGFTLVIKRTFGSQEKEREAIEKMLLLDVKGLIVMPVHGQYYSPQLLKLILEHFPVVLVDRFLEGLSVSYVGTNNFEASKKLAKYLLDLNHKNICLISNNDTNTTSLRDRIRGFRSVHFDNGIISNKEDWLTDFGISPYNNYTIKDTSVFTERIKHFLETHPDTTALFVMEYDLATIAYKTIRELGKRVPEDYSIVCFDGFLSNRDRELEFFTHAHQDEEGIGKQAVEILAKHMNGDTTIMFCEIDCEIIVAKSTARIRK